MTTWHINNEGDLGVCSAKRKCRFGGESGRENHFDNAADAAVGFEAYWKDKEIPTVKKEASATNQKAPARQPRKSTAPKIKKWKATPRGLPEHIAKKYPDLERPVCPHPADSKVIAPVAKADHSGYMGGSVFVGGKVQSTQEALGTSYIPLGTVAKLAREDIKKAVALGELPEEYAYDVRQGYSGINILISERVPGSRKRKIADESAQFRPADQERASHGDERTYNREDERELIEEYGFHLRRGDGLVETDRSKQLKEYLEALGSQWKSSEINSQVDYFNSYNGCSVRWRTKWD